MINGRFENESKEIPTAATISEENEDNNLYYNCPECPSLIEILSIDEKNNNIEYNCLNKKYFHGKNIIKIPEYLTKMRKFNSQRINKDTCDLHSSKYSNNEYISYCFDCNYHLCNECLKTRTHINHIKNNIIEIKPMKEELKIIEEIIKDYSVNLDTIRKEKYNEEKIIEEEINIKKNKEYERIEKILELNNREEKEEMRINKEQYMKDIEEIKRRYEEEMKQRKLEYLNENKNISNKYKYLNEKENTLYKIRIEHLDDIFKARAEKLNYGTKIEKLNSIKNLIEVVYNTYCAFNNNYFNAININKILLHYHNNEYINDTIMKRTLKENYESTLTKILQKRNQDMSYFKLKKEIEGEEKIIIYKINKNEKKVKIFGKDFVKNNKNKLKIIFEDTEYDLQEEFHLDNSFINKDMLVIKIKGLSFITDMSYMFNNCNSLIDLPDISTWNISNVKDISYMFYDCSSLKKLPDISGLNTQNIKNMSYVFYNCKTLSYLPDISKWDTSNVNNMSGMFYKCLSLLSLPDLSKWNTNNVNKMSYMFYSCKSLNSLPDISMWNFDNVNNICEMFSNCSSIQSLPEINKWNTYNVSLI